MSGIERLLPLHTVSFQIRILLLKNLCKAQVCRLLLEAAVLTRGGGLAHLLIFHFHLCISPSGWLGVAVALSFFGPLSVLCVLPLLSVFLLFSILGWFPTGQWDVRDVKWQLWQPSVGWDGMVVVTEHPPLTFHLPL